MSFLDEAEYDDDENFTTQQLGELTPEKIMKFFNKETFNVAEAPDGHDMLPLIRSNTLKYWKKAISSFMPNCLMAWNELSQVENPT